ncbi:class II aldolase/adducin family protein [Cellulomonas sp. ES6]|uniref:class II aldolase/adducin family protein n=1 Tax=Cellulomonas sp. ES6 TaxID=3039384 RepID=UPI0024B71A0A|nr:class II aldolase/adducin family protein [Cellulomonas sp. ES6]WHP16374.1 class II aldolase/adducin family protein [Cellulomonas sp. ES6]
MTTADSAREAVVAACRHLAARGLSPGGSGNVSVRVGDHLLVTPTGSSLSRVRPEDLALVPVAPGPGDDAPTDATPGTGTAVVDGPRPSKELPLHRAVYAARPDARAVVHLHSPAAVAASCLEPAALPPGTATGPLPATTPYQVMRLGELPVAPFALPGSAELAAGVADLAGAAPVLLLANHGSVVAGTHLDAAVDLAEELEAAAQVVLLLHGVPHRRLTPAQVRSLRPR